MNKLKREADKSKFRHQVKERVKFHEVDVLGVCNNAVYFNYFEDGRLGYVHDLKKNTSSRNFSKEILFLLWYIITVIISSQPI